MLAVLFLSSPAGAELETSLGLASEDRFRGVAASGGRPVAVLDVSLDDVAGPYLGGSITLRAPGHDGARVKSWIAYAGYAHRFGSGVGIDAGMSYRRYPARLGLPYGDEIIEAFLGAVVRGGAVHVFFSPDYDGRGRDALYSQVEASVVERPGWRIAARFGLLLPPRAPGYGGPMVKPDWTIGLVVPRGRVDFSADYDGEGKEYGRRWQRRDYGRTAFVIGARYHF